MFDTSLEVLSAGLPLILLYGLISWIGFSNFATGLVLILLGGGLTLLALNEIAKLQNRNLAYNGSYYAREGELALLNFPASGIYLRSHQNPCSNRSAQTDCPSSSSPSPHQTIEHLPVYGPNNNPNNGIRDRDFYFSARDWVPSLFPNKDLRNRLQSQPQQNFGNYPIQIRPRAKICGHGPPIVTKFQSNGQTVMVKTYSMGMKLSDYYDFW